MPSVSPGVGRLAQPLVPFRGSRPAHGFQVCDRLAVEDEQCLSEDVEVYDRRKLECLVPENEPIVDVVI